MSTKNCVCVCVYQVAAVREGMSWIVPVPLLSLLTARQLEQMVCGLAEISVEVLKKVVRYREVEEQQQLVQWFWQTLDEFSNEERMLFMRFVSGRSRLPANTADISQRFQIMKVDRVRNTHTFSVCLLSQNHSFSFTHSITSPPPNTVPFSHTFCSHSPFLSTAI